MKTLRKTAFWYEIMFTLITAAISSMHRRLYFARWMLNFYLKNMHMQISTNRFNYPATNILYSQAKMLSKVQVAEFGLGTAYEDSSPAYRCLPGFCISPSVVSRHAVMCFRRKDMQDIKIKALGRKRVFFYMFAVNGAESITSTHIWWVVLPVSIEKSWNLPIAFTW